MARDTKLMQQLKTKLVEIREQMRVLQGKEELLLDMIRAESGEPEPARARHRARRSGVKSAVLDLLAQVKADGLNAAKAVQMAEARGEQLDRGTVSSLLSRLKGEGIVTYVGGLYRLREHSPDEHEIDLLDEPAPNVRPLRTSGVAS